MKQLNQYTEAELLAELERRKKPTRPDYKLSVSANELITLQNACEAYLDNCCDDDMGDERQYIFETAMELLYGKKVWDYINAQYS